MEAFSKLQKGLGGGAVHRLGDCAQWWHQRTLKLRAIRHPSAWRMIEFDDLSAAGIGKRLFEELQPWIAK